MSDLEAIVRWYLALTLVSAALLPFVAWSGAGLGSARFGLVRPLGITTLTAIVWWMAGLLRLPFTGVTLAIATIVFGAAGWVLWWRRGSPRFSLRSIAAFEALWLLLFLAYAWFRGFNPDIANTEKPMEIALLSSISRSSEVPAPDPWLAGSTINYYYFGFQIVASIVRLSGVPAAIGFNLALATVFASAGTAAAAATAGLLRTVRLRRHVVLVGALLAVVLLLVSGNMETTTRLVRDPVSTIDAGWWDGVGWQASRVVVDEDVHQAGDERQTINEFPAFSFVLGDLHPHVIALPLLASVLALAIGLASSRTHARSRRWRLFVSGALAGLLYATNSWDAPTAVVLLLAAVVSPASPARGWRSWLLEWLVVLAGAVVAALPFLLHFVAPVGVPPQGVPRWLLNVPLVGTVVSTFGIVTWRPSSVGELLTVHAVWIATCVAFIGSVLASDRGLLAAMWSRRHVLLGVGLLQFGIAVAWMPAAFVIGAPLGFAIWVVLRSTQPENRLVAAVFASGFGLILVAEVVYFQDVFADRMNTVFKLYLQAWLLLAIASAAGVVLAIQRTRPRYRLLASSALVVGVAVTLSYTPLSTYGWTNGFNERVGLNGEQYIAATSPDDFAAIEWIRDRAERGDVIVEAPGCSYDVIAGVPMNRVSAFSGVPTLVGWIGHEQQWRRGAGNDVWGMLQRRADEANAVLDGSIPPDRTNARFIIVGRQELEGAASCDEVSPRSAEALALMQSNGWVVAFEQGGTRILVPADDRAIAPRR